MNKDTENNIWNQITDRSKALSPLDLFALRAPAEIPRWFHPDMAPIGKAPPLDPPPNLPGNITFLLRSWRKDETESIDDALLAEHPAAEAWYRAWEVYEYRVNTRHVELEQARIAQWPWAWAKMVMAQRPELNRMAMDTYENLKGQGIL